MKSTYTQEIYPRRPAIKLPREVVLVMGSTDPPTALWKIEEMVGTAATDVAGAAGAIAIG